MMQVALGLFVGVLAAKIVFAALRRAYHRALRDAEEGIERRERESDDLAREAHELWAEDVRKRQDA